MPGKRRVGRALSSGRKGLSGGKNLTAQPPRGAAETGELEFPLLSSSTSQLLKFLPLSGETDVFQTTVD